MDESRDLQREQKKNLLRRQVISSGPDSEEAYQAKLRAHKIRSWLIICGIVAVLALGFIGYRIIDSVRNLTGYRIDWELSLESGDSAYTGYEAFGEGILKVGKSGATYIGSDGAQVWSEAYEMKSPIAQTRGEYAAVADLNSNNLALFSITGKKLCQVTTPGPIMRIAVAGQGVMAVLVQDGLSDSIYFYDKAGNRLEVEVKTSFAQDGYPLDIALSANGQILMYSYVSVEEGTIKNKVNFYNFGDEGQKYQDRMVAGFKYGDSMIPRVRIMGNGNAVAFGDRMISFYSLKKVDEPSRLDRDRVFEHGINLIFYSDEYVGVVEAGESQREPGTLHVYQPDGKELLAQKLSQEYEEGIFAGDEILLYNNGACMLITLGGHIKYEGSMEGGVDFMAAGTERNQLLVAGGGKIRSCTLK